MLGISGGLFDLNSTLPLLSLALVTVSVLATFLFYGPAYRFEQNKKRLYTSFNQLFSLCQKILQENIDGGTQKQAYLLDRYAKLVCLSKFYVQYCAYARLNRLSQYFIPLKICGQAKKIDQVISQLT
jgi:hypothetical protein